MARPLISRQFLFSHSTWWMVSINELTALNHEILTSTYVPDQCVMSWSRWRSETVSWSTNGLKSTKISKKFLYLKSLKWKKCKNSFLIPDNVFCLKRYWSINLSLCALPRTKTSINKINEKLHAHKVLISFQYFLISSLPVKRRIGIALGIAKA